MLGTLALVAKCLIVESGVPNGCQAIAKNHAEVRVAEYTESEDEGVCIMPIDQVVLIPDCADEE